jgi:hypothetical protein
MTCVLGTICISEKNEQNLVIGKFRDCAITDKSKKKMKSTTYSTLNVHIDHGLVTTQM